MTESNHGEISNHSGLSRGAKAGCLGREILLSIGRLFLGRLGLSVFAQFQQAEGRRTHKGSDAPKTRNRLQVIPGYT